MTEGTVAIDPGKHFFGVACFSVLSDGARPALTWAQLVEREHMTGWVQSLWCGPIDFIVVEKPHKQARTVKVNDIIDVAVAAGEVAARLQQLYGGEIKYVRPDQWGGQAPKPIKNKRAKEALSQLELKRITMPRAAKTLGHNIWDAVSIGLWATGRVKRSGR